MSTATRRRAYPASRRCSTRRTGAPMVASTRWSTPRRWRCAMNGNSTVNLSFGLMKTAVDDAAALLLAREARLLRELEEMPELEGHVPRVLDEGTRPDGRPYLVISMWPARGETRAFTGDHARFLAKL